MSSKPALDARTVSRPNLKEVVSSRVRDLIFAGQIRPETRIDQDRLASELGVSRLPVREALIGLEMEGLVDNVPRRGSFVAHLTASDFRDHFNIIGVVSGLAAERACDIISDDDLANLRLLHEHMASATTEPEYARLNFDFHRLINRAADSRRLRSVLTLLTNTVPEHFFESTEGWHHIALADHARIIAALERHDGVAARREMEQHLRNSGDQAVAVLRARGFWAAEMVASAEGVS